MKKIFSTLLGKIISGLVLILLATGVYFLFPSQSADSSEYTVLTTVEKGTLTSSISASGQVSSAEEIELQPEASGRLVGVYVEEGDAVYAGQLLAVLDSTKASTSIAEAELNLEQARLDLEELSEPADEIDIKKAENAVTEAEIALADLLTNYEDAIADKQKEILSAQDDIPSAYDRAYNAAVAVFAELPDVMEDIEDILEDEGNLSSRHSDAVYYVILTYSEDLSDARVELEEHYEEDEDIYDLALIAYEETNREDLDSIEALVDQTYVTLAEFSDLLKELGLFLTLVDEELGSDSEYASYVEEQRDLVSADLSTINPLLTDIYDELESLIDLEDSIVELESEIEKLGTQYEQDKSSAELSLQEKQLELTDLKNSEVTDLDYRNQELIIRQKENALEEARKNYNDYFIYAPVGGYISSLDASEGENISSGTLFATLVDDAQQVVVSLNELDISDVEVGQSATLEFDAIPDLTVDATVVEKSITGTVNSGVVSYEVTVSIQSEDERILVGMSTDLEIVLMSKKDVTLIPQTAVKTDEQGSYVEVISNGDELAQKPFYSASELSIEKKYIELGEQDSTNYEVISGIEAGTQIVLMTVNTSSEEEASSSLFPSGGGIPDGEFSPPSGGSGSFPR